MKTGSLIYCGLQTVRANLTSHRVPLSVYLYLTARCPNKCIYCNYPNLESLRKEEMSTEQILKLIDEMAEAGVKKLQLTGGEPFLRRDLGRIISRAKERGIYIGVSASGVFIPERIDEIKDVDIIFISLDGPKEVHDSIRGEGSYERAVRAIDLLKENGIDVWTTTVINRKNRDSIDYVFNFARERRLTANFVLFYYVDDVANDHLGPQDMIKELALDNEENAEVIRYLIEKKRLGEPIGSSFDYFDYLLEWKDFGVLHRNDILKGVKCWAGKLFCHIDYKGMLYPCGTSYWRVKGHSVTELGFKEAFKRASNIPCNSCIMACHLEQNLVFSLNSHTIMDWLRTLRRRK